MDNNSKVEVQVATLTANVSNLEKKVEVGNDVSSRIESKIDNFMNMLNAKVDGVEFSDLSKQVRALQDWKLTETTVWRTLLTIMGAIGTINAIYDFIKNFLK